MITLRLQLPDEQALALAQLAERFTFEDAKRLSNAFDEGEERDSMLDGIGAVQRALRDAGIAPR